MTNEHILNNIVQNDITELKDDVQQDDPEIFVVDFNNISNYSNGKIQI